MPKRKDEELAKYCFKSYLLDRFDLKTNWEDGPKNEAPDYYMQLGDTRFAVEVTTLSSRDLDYRHSLKKLAKDIEKKARQQSILKGHYAIGFGHRFTDFKKDRTLIREEALKYIEATKSLHKTKEHSIIRKEGFQICKIFKTQAKGNKVFWVVIPPIELIDSPEFKKRVRNILQCRVFAKKKILRNIDLPKILLLLHKVAYIEPEHYKEYVMELESVEVFHSIFIAKYPTNSYFLYTQEKRWGSFPG